MNNQAFNQTLSVPYGASTWTTYGSGSNDIVYNLQVAATTAPKVCTSGVYYENVGDGATWKCEVVHPQPWWAQGDHAVRMACPWVLLVLLAALLPSFLIFLSVVTWRAVVELTTFPVYEPEASAEPDVTP